MNKLILWNEIEIISKKERKVITVRLELRFQDGGIIKKIMKFIKDRICIKKNI